MEGSPQNQDQGQGSAGEQSGPSPEAPDISQAAADAGRLVADRETQLQIEAAEAEGNVLPAAFDQNANRPHGGSRLADAA